MNEQWIIVSILQGTNSKLNKKQISHQREQPTINLSRLTEGWDNCLGKGGRFQTYTYTCIPVPYLCPDPHKTINREIHKYNSSLYSQRTGRSGWGEKLHDQQTAAAPSGGSYFIPGDVFQLKGNEMLSFYTFQEDYIFFFTCSTIGTHIKETLLIWCSGHFLRRQGINSEKPDTIGD